MSNTANIILDISILIFVSIGILISVGLLYLVYYNQHPMLIDSPILFHVGIYSIYYSYLLQLCFRFFRIVFL
jgi:hypothetical protein